MVTEKRTERLPAKAYLTKAEHERLSHLAKASGYSRSGYLRKLLMGAVPPALPPAEFYEFTNEINRIGVNINQIAKVANMTGHIMEAELNAHYGELRQVLSEIRRIYLRHRRIGDGNNENMGSEEQPFRYP